jgi:hypothetical protein
MKLVIPILVFVLVGVAWWIRQEEVHALTRSPATATASATDGRAAPTVARPAQVSLIHRELAEPPLAANATETEKLRANDEKLRRKLDEGIPIKLSAEAARCYHGGLDRSKRIDLTYRLHVEDSKVHVTDVRIDESTLGDRALEECIRQRLLAAVWRDDSMPDIDEEDDLFLSVRQFKQFTGFSGESRDGTEPGPSE